MMANPSRAVNDNPDLCQDPRRNRLSDVKLCPAAIAMQQAEKRRQLEALRKMIAEREGRSHADVQW